MEETIGHITAIGSVTMESGTVIGNSLKTIYSRITTVKGAEKALNDVGVAIHRIGEDGQKQIKPVNDILKDLSLVWNDLTDAQRQHLTVMVAGRYQLNRFSALMNNYDTALESTNTAIFSQGSALRENAKYMKSFEARINQMKNSFSELALAVGDAFLSSGMLAVISLLKNMAVGFANVSEKIGVLPVLFLGLFAILTKFGVLKGFHTAIVSGLTAMRAGALSTVVAFTTARNATTTLQATTLVAGSAMTAMFGRVVSGARAMSVGIRTAFTAIKASFMSLMASTGIGLLFVGVGIAIEKLVSKFQEAKQEAEALKDTTDKLVNAYRTFGQTEGLNKMIDRFTELEEKTNRTVEETEEMNRIQADLANNLVTTVDYVDAQGNAHLKNNEMMKEQVKIAEELSKLEAKRTNAEYSKNAKKNQKAIKDVRKEIEKAEKELSRLQKNDGKDVWGYGYEEDNTMAMIDQETKLLNLKSELTEQVQATLTTIKETSLAYLEQEGYLANMGDAQQKVVENLIDMNHELIKTTDGSEASQNKLKELAQMVGITFSNAKKEIEDAIDVSLTTAEQSRELDEINLKFTQIAKAIPPDLLKLDKNGNLPLTQKELDIIIKQLYEMDETDTFDSLAKEISSLGIPLESAKQLVANFAKETKNSAIQAQAQKEGIEGVTEATDDYIEATIEARDLTKDLFGFSSGEMQALQSQLQYLDLLVGMHGEVAKSSDQFIEAERNIAEALGVTTEFVRENQTELEAIMEELPKLDPMAKHDWMSVQEWINNSEMSDYVKGLFKTMSDGGMEIEKFIGKLLEVTYSTDALAESQKEVTMVTENTITAQEGLAEATDKTTEAVNNLNNTGFSDKFKQNLDSLGNSIVVAKDELGNLKLQLGEEGTPSTAIDEINAEIEEMGGKLSVVKDDMGELSVALSQGGENYVIAKLNKDIQDTNLNLDETAKKIDEINETEAKPKVDIDFQPLTDGTKEVYDNMQELDEAFVKLEDNVQKMSAIEEMVNNLKTFVSDLKDSFSAIFDTKTDFDGLKETVLATTTAVTELKTAIDDIKNLASRISIGGFEDIQLEVETTMKHIQNLKTALDGLPTSSANISVQNFPELTLLKDTLLLLQQSFASLTAQIVTLRAQSNSAIKDLAKTVTSNTNQMINKHNAQKTAIDRLANSARSAKNEMSLLNSFAESSSQAVRNYSRDTYTTIDNLKPYLTAESVGYNVGTTKAVNGHYNTSVQSVSANSTTSSGNTGSTSTGIGTSGIVRPSYNRAIGINGHSVLYAMGSGSLAGRPSGSSSSSKKSSSSSNTKTRDELFVRDWYETTAEGFSANLDLFKAQLEGLKQGSEEYRKVLKKIVQDENNYLYVISEQMKALNSRNVVIGNRLKQLSNTSKHSIAQREEYNELLKELDDNEKRIQSLRTEVTSATIELKATAQAVMQDVVDEILNAFEYTLTSITRRMETIDFKIEVLDITDSDNQAEKMNLMADKVREMAREQENYNTAIKSLESKLFYATQTYGKQSQIVKDMTAELETLQDSWRETYLEILRTEQEIKQMRTDISNEIIDELKGHYATIRDMEIKAKNDELNDFKESHEAKMDLYDDEIEKIRELYDTRIRMLDDEASEDDYQEELLEKNNELSKLLNERNALSSDDSLEGRKRLRDKEKEVVELQKDIDKFMLQRQRELTKQQLADQRDYEIKRLEGTKENYENELEEKELSIERETDLIAEKYNAFIDDEERWSNIRNELIKGSFSTLSTELGNMGINIEQQSNGIFSTLSENFSAYSIEVQNFVNKINGMVGNINDVSNLNVGSLGNSSPEGIVKVGEPIRSQDVSFIIDKAKKGIAMDIETPDKKYLYDLIQNSDLSKYLFDEIWKKAQTGTALDVPTAEKMMFYNLFQEIIKKNKMKSFDTGGYTGSWGSSGKLAMLHEKELVLNKNQTEDILNVVKLMEKMSLNIPKINRNSSVPLASTSSSGQTGDNYELNIHIEKFGGTKDETDNLGKELLNLLKKTGRKK